MGNALRIAGVLKFHPLFLLFFFHELYDGEIFTSDSQFPINTYTSRPFPASSSLPRIAESPLKILNWQ